MKTFEQFLENLANLDGWTHVRTKSSSPEDGSYELEVTPGETIYQKLDDAVRLISRGAKVVTFEFNGKKLMVTHDNYVSFIRNVIPQHFAIK